MKSITVTLPTGSVRASVERTADGQLRLLRVDPTGLAPDCRLLVGGQWPDQEHLEASIRQLDGAQNQGLNLLDQVTLTEPAAQAAAVALRDIAMRIRDQWPDLTSDDLPVESARIENGELVIFVQVRGTEFTIRVPPGQWAMTHTLN